MGGGGGGGMGSSNQSGRARVFTFLVGVYSMLTENKKKIAGEPQKRHGKSRTRISVDTRFILGQMMSR